MAEPSEARRVSRKASVGFDAVDDRTALADVLSAPIVLQGTMQKKPSSGAM